MIRRTWRAVAAIGGLLLAAPGLAAPEQSAALQFPPARTLVPFVKHAEVDCDWMMHDPREEWIRGSIGQGDEDPVFSIVDYAFKTWSDSEDHAIEVSAGDPARRAPVKAWAGSDQEGMPGSIGFYMNAPLRAIIGGATSLQIWKEGKPVYNAILAGTPSAAELHACVRPPSDPALDDSE